MHPLFAKADSLTGTIIAAAVEVHRTLGPGLLESIYERCLMHELHLRNLGVDVQRMIPVHYKDIVFEELLKYDVLVEGCVLVEVKACEIVLPIHKAQAISYMKLLNVPIGLLINFHEPTVVSGVSRLLLPGANRSPEKN